MNRQFESKKKRPPHIMRGLPFWGRVVANYPPTVRIKIRLLNLVEALDFELWIKIRGSIANNEGHGSGLSVNVCRPRESLMEYSGRRKSKVGNPSQEIPVPKAQWVFQHTFKNSPRCPAVKAAKNSGAADGLDAKSLLKGVYVDRKKTGKVNFWSLAKKISEKTAASTIGSIPPDWLEMSKTCHESAAVGPPRTQHPAQFFVSS